MLQILLTSKVPSGEKKHPKNHALKYKEIKRIESGELSYRGSIIQNSHSGNSLCVTNGLTDQQSWFTHR
jgi:hypothetical protein